MVLSYKKLSEYRRLAMSANLLYISVNKKIFLVTTCEGYYFIKSPLLYSSKTLYRLPAIS